MKESVLPFEKIKRKLLMRKTGKISKFGCTPEERGVEELMNYGIVNINKPQGPTSHQVSAYVQKILGIEKSGHSGTLDPKVTGVLPIALGRGTKIVQALINTGKEYICILYLHKAADENKIREVMGQFVGKIRQMPPLKSAVKRQFRYRKIYYLDILEIDGQSVLFRVGCQAGTYIRKLCHDIGEKLGMRGHMAELIRTKAAIFRFDDCFSLQDLTDAVWYYQHEGNEKYIRQVIQPIEAATAHLPKVYVLDSSIESLCHGVDLAVPGISKVATETQVGELVALLSLKGELIALGLAKMTSGEMLKKIKGMAVKVEKVFMLPGTYPRMRQ